MRDYPEAISVAFVDKDPQALTEARKLVGQGPAQFHTDLNVALREVPADVALITSPSFFHAEHALEALEAGLTVLTEKPFATNLGDAQKSSVKRMQLANISWWLRTIVFLRRANGRPMDR